VARHRAQCLALVGRSADLGAQLVGDSGELVANEHRASNSVEGISHALNPATVPHVAGAVNLTVQNSRGYDSPVRRARALETERRILHAADALFAERGYVGTSLAAIAERAGVNTRTLYKVFETKVRLLSRLVDIAMVGDQAAVAVSERPWAAEAFDAETGDERVRIFAAAVRRVMESAGRAFRTAAQAAAADDEAAELWRTGQRHRHVDATAFTTSLERDDLLRSDRTRDQAIATVWLVSSPESFIQLTDGLELTLDEYQLWVEQILRDTVVRADPAGRPPGSGTRPARAKARSATSPET
jgi:AcrR family transcriptional regulator